MPELPDIAVYLDCLKARVAGATLERVRLGNPFLLRTIDPPLRAVEGKRIEGFRRIGKRVVLALEGQLFVVIHLMIAGRLKWAEKGAKLPGRLGLAAFDFGGAPYPGTMILTEAGTKRRASLHLVAGEERLASMDPGGIDPLRASPGDVLDVLRRERHTLKRSLTDPHLFSGIGNAYSDEILHRAKLSPFTSSTTLDEPGVTRLHAAMQSVLLEWTDRLRTEATTAGGWPREVTAFRPEMAVHGKFRAPCPVCGAPVQRVVYAENEMDYCPGCQTEGRILSDRSLSRLLGEDWPRSLDDLEERPGLGVRPAETSTKPAESTKQARSAKPAKKASRRGGPPAAGGAGTSKPSVDPE